MEWCFPAKELVSMLTSPPPSAQLSPAEGQHVWLLAIYSCLYNKGWKYVFFFIFVKTKW